MAAHTFRHSTCKAETGKQLLRLRTDWSTEWVTQQPELYRVNPSQKQNEEWTREKNRKKRNTETFALYWLLMCVSLFWRLEVHIQQWFNSLGDMYEFPKLHISLLLIIAAKLKQKLFSSWKFLDT